MSLNIAVCIKSVPDPEQYDNIKIDPVKKTLVRSGIASIINPTDKHALELALQLKEKFDGKVIVLTMAPPNAEKELKEALAMGADEAYLLSDRKLGGADTLATSYSLSKALDKIGQFDLILAGNESADGATSHVPSQLGEWMNIPHIMEVIDYQSDDEKQAKIRRKVENGYAEYEITLPAVIAVTRDVNTPRYISVMGIIKAKNKKLEVLSTDNLDDLDYNYIGLDGSPTKAGELKILDVQRESKLIEGTEEEIAKSIYSKMKTTIGNL